MMIQLVVGGDSKSDKCSMDISAFFDNAQEENEENIVDDEKETDCTSIS